MTSTKTSWASTSRRYNCWAGEMQALDSPFCRLTSATPMPRRLGSVLGPTAEDSTQSRMSGYRWPASQVTVRSRKNIWACWGSFAEGPGKETVGREG